MHVNVERIPTKPSQLLLFIQLEYTINNASTNLMAHTVKLLINNRKSRMCLRLSKSNQIISIREAIAYLVFFLQRYPNCLYLKLLVSVNKFCSLAIYFSQMLLNTGKSEIGLYVFPRVQYKGITFANFRTPGKLFQLARTSANSGAIL